MTEFADVPIEIQLLIVQKQGLPLETIGVFTQVSKQMNEIANNNSHWQERFKTHFPLVYEKIDNSSRLEANFKNLFKYFHNQQYKHLSKKLRQLFWLVKEGDINNLKEVTIKKSECLIEDKNGLNILAWARKNNNQAVLDYLFKKIILKTFVYTNGIYDPTMRDEHKMFLIHWGVLCRQSTTVLQELCDTGSSLEPEGKCKQTPLMLAAMYNEIVSLKFLLEKGAKTNLETCSGATALLYAIKQGHQEVVNELLNHKDINISVSIKKNSINHSPLQVGDKPIHAAVRFGRLEIVKSLLSKGADLQCTNNFGDSPLHAAARMGNEAMVQLLLKHNVNQKAINLQGKTPAQVAINSRIKAMLTLDKYIEKRSNNKKAYKASFEMFGTEFFNASFTLFGEKFNFSNEQKIQAAQALKTFLDEGEQNKISLREHQEALNNGKLGKLYKSIVSA